MHYSAVRRRAGFATKIKSWGAFSMTDVAFGSVFRPNDRELAELEAAHAAEEVTGSGCLFSTGAAAGGGENSGRCWGRDKDSDDDGVTARCRRNERPSIWANRDDILRAPAKRGRAALVSQRNNII